MTLKPCRQCGAEVSTEAAKCPYCGADMIALMIRHVASALASIYMRSRKKLPDLDWRAEDVAAIRASFAARGAMSQDDFRHRVVDAAQGMTLTLDEGGIETMADRHELEIELRGALNEGLQVLQ